MKKIFSLLLLIGFLSTSYVWAQSISSEQQVKIDAMVAEYWHENSHLYAKPLRHEGRVLLSTDRDAVFSAYEEARAGAEWDGLVMSYAEAAKMPQTGKPNKLISLHP